MGGLGFLIDKSHGITQGPFQLFYRFRLQEPTKIFSVGDSCSPSPAPHRTSCFQTTTTTSGPASQPSPTENTLPYTQRSEAGLFTSLSSFSTPCPRLCHYIRRIDKSISPRKIIAEPSKPAAAVSPAQIDAVRYIIE